jgi:peptidyl-tRNA hydrolase, PTH1 family
MKFLIAGLGNIGDKYQDTRHNIGFNTLDVLASTSNVFFKLDRLAEVAEVKHKGRTLVLIKPTTFMNLSGKAVNYWLQKEKIPVDRLLVITDDISLPFGKIRLRPKGSDGGHNGLKDIQQTLNTSEYARLRFGVGNEFPKGRQAEYVLGKWTDEEFSALNPRIQLAIDAIYSFTTIGIAQTMTEFNSK